MVEQEFSFTKYLQFYFNAKFVPTIENSAKIFSGEKCFDRITKKRILLLWKIQYKPAQKPPNPHQNSYRFVIVNHLN